MRQPGRPSLIIPGLAIATSISYLVGAIAGEIWLRARYGPMGTKRTLVTLVKMTVAGAAGAGAALLAGNRLLTFDVDTLGEALVEILLSGTVGLLVIAIVAVLLKVEELVPLRNRIAALLRRIFRRGSANPGASSGVKTTAVTDTERGTLVGDDAQQRFCGDRLDGGRRRDDERSEQQGAGGRTRCPTTAVARPSDLRT